MSDEPTTPDETLGPWPGPLLSATARILRPLVRILLRNGVASDAVTEFVRRVYVDVAFDEFALEGKRPTQSRVSVLTGLNRKEVARLRAERESVLPAREGRRNRAAGVIAAWLRDPDFQDEGGQPRPLPFSGPGSFSELCQRHSGDMKPRSIADELVSAGALVNEDGKLRMTARGYVPGEDPVELLGILGTDTSELIETIDHNLCARPDQRRYQSKVKYDNVPAEHVADFLHYSSSRAQMLLEDLDRWLAERDRGERPAGDERRVSLGLGTFQILGESPHDPAPEVEGAGPTNASK
jgi:hypothetical protein